MIEFYAKMTKISRHRTYGVSLRKSTEQVDGDHVNNVLEGSLVVEQATMHEFQSAA